MEDRTAALGAKVQRALERLLQERLAHKPGGHLVEGRLRELELRLPMPTAGADGNGPGFTERLVRSIDELLDDAVHQAAAFRPGHVWCHRCRAVDCEHSTPASSRQVFTGYTPTGLPRWQDFAQVCLDLKHPQVDRLYDERPAFLTLIQDAATLRGKMLEAFEHEAYEILGQIVAGFFPVRVRAEEGRGVLALTVQVASSRTRRGSVRLGLNLLGRSPSGEGLDRLWERQDDLPWHRSVRWAQSALETLRPGGDRKRLASRVDGILNGLARRLEREQRARGRRTRHAAEHHQSGERPTRKALDDARAAAEGELLVDARSGTLVVLGERGRTHFFTEEGKLVSSVRYSRDAIVRKLKTEKWLPAPDELRAAFIEKLPR